MILKIGIQIKSDWLEENYIPTLLAPAYLARASTHTSAAVQPAPVQVQYAQPVQ